MVREGGVAGCELSYVAVVEGEELGRDELFARYVSLSLLGIRTRKWGGCYPRRVYTAGPILQFPQLWCLPRPHGQISRPEKNTWSLLSSIQTLVLLSSLLNDQSSVMTRKIESEGRDDPQKMQSPSVSSSGRIILIILSFPSRNTPPSKPSSFSFFGVFFIGHHERCCA